MNRWTPCGCNCSSSGGITQLTQDVLAGPGSGSVPATVIQITGQAGVCVVVPGTNISFETTGHAVSTAGRINFAGDVANTFLAMHFSGIDYAVLATDGVGDLFLGLGTIPSIIIDAASTVELAAGGSSQTTSSAGINIVPAGVSALDLITSGTGSGLGVQSVTVALGAGGTTTLSLGEGIRPGIQCTGALTSSATLVFGDAQGLYFVDTSQVTGISGAHTLTFQNASGATTTPITANAGFYIVWVDSQGPNTILAGALTLA